MGFEWWQLIGTIIAAIGASIMTTIATRRTAAAQAEKLESERKEIEESLPSELAERLIGSAGKLIQLKDKEAEVRQARMEILEAERAEFLMMIGKVTRDLSKLRSALLILNSQLQSVGEAPIIDVEALLASMESVE